MTQHPGEIDPYEKYAGDAEFAKMRALTRRGDRNRFLLWMGLLNCGMLGVLAWFIHLANGHGEPLLGIGVAVLYGLLSLQHSGIEDRLIGIGFFISLEAMKSAAQRESWHPAVLEGRTADTNALLVGERWVNNMRTIRSIAVLGYALVLMYHS